MLYVFRLAEASMHKQWLTPYIYYTQFGSYHVQPWGHKINRRLMGFWERNFCSTDFLWFVWLYFSFELFLVFFRVKRWIILPLCESNSHLNVIVWEVCGENVSMMEPLISQRHLKCHRRWQLDSFLFSFGNGRKPKNIGKHCFNLWSTVLLVYLVL